MTDDDYISDNHFSGPDEGMGCEYGDDGDGTLVDLQSGFKEKSRWY